jgi:triacylglycerol esterase/lipase EstA (alpha/beta hydrolase family)
MPGRSTDPPVSRRALAGLGAALLALGLLGCQTSPRLAPEQQAGGPPAPASLAPALARSIDDLARSRARATDKADAEARHRALVAAHLPALLTAATPPHPAAGVQDADALQDPAQLAGVRPVLRPTGDDTGLRRSGVGLPVVARLPAAADPNAPRAGYHLPATLVAQPRAGSAATAAALADPDAAAQVPTAAGTLPVAMDLRAPIDATTATGIRPLAAIGNLLRPGRFRGEPRIVFLEPFQPDKTPLVLVHGLLSTPDIWKPLVTQLWADPRIRDCCQLWFFYYPTGQPVPLSALQLRYALDDAVAHTGLDRPMILIGHSMGGILSRAQVSGIGPTRAETIVPGVSDLAEYNRVRRALIFEPRTDVARAVFLFTPHRGSRLAANGAGALVVNLIQLPDTLLNETEHALHQLAGGESRRLPTSIHGLSPRSRFLRALDATTPTVPVHSVLGNRGRGDGSSGSDGVVPVSSARLAAAESEVIVPTGHGGFDHPAAVAEVTRIVLLEVEQQRAAAAPAQP